MNIKFKIKTPGESSGNPSIGREHIKDWEKLEALSDIFEDLFFAVSALNTNNPQDLQETILVQIDRCDEIIASAEEAVSIGLEMIEIAERIKESCDDHSLIKTLVEQIKAIDLDIGILMDTADAQHTTLKGYKIIAKEMSGTWNVIQDQIDNLLAQAPIDDNDAN